MSISLTPFSLPLSRPLETAKGKIENREGFVVSAEKSGRKGIGEVTPLPGWTESLVDCERALRRAIEASEESGALGGTDETDFERTLDAMSEHETPAARHGLAMAISDLRARDAGVPLYRHLGGNQCIKRVPVNATIGDSTPKETARATGEAIDEGVRCLKVKVGARDVERDTARLRAIRDRVADAEANGRIEIRADANGAWSLGEAQRALAAFKAVWKEGNGNKGELAYVEQPLSPTDLAGHATLRAESEIPIALDESLAEFSIERIRDAGAADVVICKPMVLGGLDRTRKTALRAREAGIDPVVTTTIDGAIGRTGATHLAASLAPIAACGLATASMLREDLVGSDPAPITDGYAAVPQEPGVLGERLRAEAIGESEP